MRKRALGRTLLLCIGIGILIALVASGGILAPVQDFTARTFAPVFRVFSGAQEGIGGSLHSFFRVRRLSRSVRILEEEKATLTARITRLEGLEKENEVLREQLRLLPRNTFRFVSGDIVSRTTDGVTDGLILNRGVSDGITEGLPVIVNEGIVVGRIQAVRSSSAVVALLTDPSFRAGAETKEHQAEGLLHGVRGIDVIFDTIPRTATIRVGDQVVTNGTDGAFPPGLLLGTVQSVDAPGNEIFQAARITPLVDIHTVSVVSVIVP